MIKKNPVKMRPNNHIYLILILITGFIVRIFTYPKVFESGRIVFIGADSYYHMYRVFSFLKTFPNAFVFDPNINYPYGINIEWPPLFDQIIVGLSLILGIGKPSVPLVETTGAFMPLILGLISIIAVFYITKEIFNERIALYSSFLLAVLPAHLQVSFLGYVDHHVAEVLLSVSAYLFFLKSIKKYSHRHSIISGIIMGLIFLTWKGAPIYAGILLFYIAVQYIFDNKNHIESPYLLKTGVIVFITASIIMIFSYFLSWWQNLTDLFFFQLTFLGVSAIIVIFLGFISMGLKKQKWPIYPITILIIASLSIIFIKIGMPFFYERIIKGIGYLLKDTPVIKGVTEAQPLFYTFDGQFIGLELFDNPVWHSFAYSFYVAIIGLSIFLYYYRNSMDRDKLFFLIWTLIIIALALNQRRFVYVLSINVAILCGLLVDRVRSYSVQPFYILLILVLIIPNISVANTLAQNPPVPSGEWYDSLKWIKYNTPDIEKTSYGIMNWWDYGNWILYISGRPVVSNNFQIGGDDAARFFIASNEIQANTIMNQRRARFVIVDRRMGLNPVIKGEKVTLEGVFMHITLFADKNLNVYLDEYNFPNKNYFQTIYARMHLYDGMGLKNYRMIYESNEIYYDLFNKPTKNIKIFEYVKGARIVGNASSNENISLSTVIKTNQDRNFKYTQEARADSKGLFEFVVPYSRDSLYKTRLMNNYELKYNNMTYSISISEDDVLNGKTVMVN